MIDSLIDTHCHLTLTEMDPEEHIQYAREQGVSKILDPGLWVSDFLERYEILYRYPEVLFGLACAPHYRGESSSHIHPDLLISQMEEIIDNYPIAALSEIGLDYYHQVRSKEDQQKLFFQQLKLAHRKDLPVFLHIREAYEDTFNLVVKSGHRLGAVHCFTGTREDAQKFTDWGFYISFSGIVTFKQSKEMQEIAKIIPDDKILTETDSPFLTPVPLRGRPNQAGNVIHINRCIATVKNWSEKTTNQTLKKNAERLLRLEGL